MDAVQGAVVSIMCVFALAMSFFLGQYTTQIEIKRKCEQFQVIDLDQAKAMFYCSREKK